MRRAPLSNTPTPTQSTTKIPQHSHPIPTPTPHTGDGGDDDGDEYRCSLHRKLDLGELFIIDSGPGEASFIVACKAKSFVCQVRLRLRLRLRCCFGSG